MSVCRVRRGVAARLLNVPPYWLPTVVGSEAVEPTAEMPKLPPLRNVVAHCEAIDEAVALLMRSTGRFRIASSLVRQGAAGNAAG